MSYFVQDTVAEIARLVVLQRPRLKRRHSDAATVNKPARNIAPPIMAYLLALAEQVCRTDQATEKHLPLDTACSGIFAQLAALYSLCCILLSNADRVCKIYQAT